MPGLFLTLEGPEGGGETTQLARLQAGNRTFLLDLPAALGLARRHASQTNRLGHESLNIHEKVRRGFLDAARAEPGRIVVLDASQSPDAVAEALWAAALPLLNR